MLLLMFDCYQKFNCNPEIRVALFKLTTNDSILIRTPLRLQLHGAIYHPDSFVMMLRYCANLDAIR